MGLFEEQLKAGHVPGAQKKTQQGPQSQSSSGNPADVDKIFASVFGDSAKSQSATMTGEQVEDALQPVAMPAPKAKPTKKATPVKTDRAPTEDEILDPQRPDLHGASHDLVLASIERLVADIYTNVLDDRLKTLQVTLAKSPPPAATPFALTLLAWVVDQIASWTIASIGKAAAKELLGHKPAVDVPKGDPTPVDMAMGRTQHADATKSPTPTVPNPGEAMVGDMATKGGAAAGGAYKQAISAPRPTTAPAPDEVPLRSQPGETLLVEFITRQHDKLHEKKNDAITVLAMIRASATGKATSEFVDLDAKLRHLIGSGELSNWFQHKVAMEWLNFVARVSMGPRVAGQSTDMIGANTIDGIPSAGAKGVQQWAGGAGFVEITLTTPDVINGMKGLAVQSTRIPSSYGAALKLKDADTNADSSGQRYNLATLPVYRRIWLQTGSSKMTTSPAFVITPEGHIEADVGNPVLAAIGAGHAVDIGETTYQVGGDRFRDEERKDPDAWSRRAVRSSQCTVGAHTIHEWLRGVGPGILK